MRHFIRALVLLPALAIAACGGGGNREDLTVPQSAELGKEFLLGYGETVDVGALSLEFTKIVDDSRCPTDGIVVCVWEGNGAILVSATNGQLSQMLTLNTNPKFPTLAIFAGHVIELRRLDPQPVSHIQPRPEDYAATLFVDGHMTTAGGT
jgi:hypothetical protein